MLERVCSWLQTFPLWEGTLQVDYADEIPGSTGLYPRGLTELSRREDVLGNVAVRCSWGFALQRAALPGEENARWLMEFQTWVADQNRLGLAPQFGDDPKQERIRAFDGRIYDRAQAGSGRYTVMLTAEFTKIYRGE